MGTLSLTNMRDALLFGLDNRRDLSTGQLDRWINWAYLHVSLPTIHRHVELQSTGNITLVNGTASYAFSLLSFTPTGIASVTHYQGASAGALTARERLRQVSMRQIEEAGSPNQGAPERYAIYGNGLVVDPVPGSAQATQILAVRAYQEPTLLTLVGDTTALQSIWDEAIVLGARWRGWRELNQPDRAEMAKGDFAAQVNEITELLRFGLEDRPGWQSEELTLVTDGQLAQQTDTGAGGGGG